MNKWISIAAVTVVMTAAACTASEQSLKMQPALSLDGRAIMDNGAAEYAKGKQLLSQGRFAVAAQAFQAALFAGGSSIQVLNALAVSYDGLGRYDLSARYYQRALTLDPDDPQTVNNLAVSLARRGVPDVAAKVFASVQARLPSDKMIADNLKRAQAEAIAGPARVAAAPRPIEAMNPPQIPRIEQMSPSMQELITMRTTHDNIISSQASALPSVVSGDAFTLMSAGTDRGYVAAIGEFPNPAAVLSEPLAPPLAATAESATAEKTASHAAQGIGSTATVVPHDVVPTPPALAEMGGSHVAITKETMMGKTQVSAVIEPTNPLTNISEPAAPPPVGMVKSKEVERISADMSQGAGNAASAVIHTTQDTRPKTVASPLPAAELSSDNSAVMDSAKLALARSRLGTRIAESQNLQPIDFIAQVGATKLAMERLGVRLEVANGAGRRYMAARMRSFLQVHGFEVSRVTNAHSFDHEQTVIVYRDTFQPEAVALAKALATKVELRHMAGLPVDVRLILGRDLFPFDRTLENGG